MIEKVFVVNFNISELPCYSQLLVFYKARQTSKFNCLQNKKAKLEYHPATLGENEVMWDTSTSA